MLGVSGSENASALKQIAAERLAAHRNKRAALQAREAAMEAQVQVRREDTRRGASQVRDAVAARYQQRLSYQEYLESESARVRAEAEAAQRRAEAEARPDLEAEARRAQALTAAQAWVAEAGDGPRVGIFSQPRAVARGESAAKAEMRSATAPMDGGRGGLRIQMYEELGAVAVQPVMPGTGTDGRGLALDPVMHEDMAGELADLDDEIAFRLSDGFENHSLEMTGIPGNLIEFPRQLVASRKARPRLAEGPLRDEGEPESQLRIFEVEPEQISVEPVAVQETSVPEWHGLELDAAIDLPEETPVQVQFAIRPLTASPARRVMAGMVDFTLVGVAFTGFAVVATVVGHGLHGVPAGRLGAAAGIVLAVLFVMYQMLFFTLNEATPGMLYARIGLCTFGDDNPKRKQMRRRVLTTLLAACPVGLGLLWMWMDDDKLGWQDRMSRVYPRSY